MMADNAVTAQKASSSLEKNIADRTVITGGKNLDIFSKNRKERGRLTIEGRGNISTFKITKCYIFEFIHNYHSHSLLNDRI